MNSSARDSFIRTRSSSHSITPSAAILKDASYTVHDGAMIVGGGLASIDVAKIHTLELTIKALGRARN